VRSNQAMQPTPKGFASKHADWGVKKVER
jgi:hypothetical protein